MQPRSSEPPPSPTRVGEMWSFWLGISSLTCLGPVTGLLAVLIGARTLARAPRGERPQLAVAGVIAGAFGTAAGVLLIVLGTGVWQARMRSVRRPPAVAPPSAAVEPPLLGPAPGLPPGHPPVGTAQANDDDGPPTATDTVGSVTVVRVSAHDPRSLVTILRSVRHVPDPLVVYVRAPRCAPCSRFEATLAHPTMQKALGPTVLVAVDAGAFEDDLHALHIDAHDVPTFIRLAPTDLGTLDAMTGIEWDDDVPQNMGPVFTRFLAGTLQNRREPPPFVGISL